MASAKCMPLGIILPPAPPVKPPAPAPTHHVLPLHPHNPRALPYPHAQPPRGGCFDGDFVDPFQSSAPSATGDSALQQQQEQQQQQRRRQRQQQEPFDSIWSGIEEKEEEEEKGCLGPDSKALSSPPGADMQATPAVLLSQQGCESAVVIGTLGGRSSNSNSSIVGNSSLGLSGSDGESERGFAPDWALAAVLPTTPAGSSSSVWAAEMADGTEGDMSLLLGDMDFNLGMPVDDNVAGTSAVAAPLAPSYKLLGGFGAERTLHTPAPDVKPAQNMGEGQWPAVDALAGLPEGTMGFPQGLGPRLSGANATGGAGERQLTPPSPSSSTSLLADRVLLGITVGGCGADAFNSAATGAEIGGSQGGDDGEHLSRAALSGGPVQTSHMDHSGASPGPGSSAVATVVPAQGRSDPSLGPPLGIGGMAASGNATSDSNGGLGGGVAGLWSGTEEWSITALRGMLGLDDDDELGGEGVPGPQSGVGFYDDEGEGSHGSSSSSFASETGGVSARREDAGAGDGGSVSQAAPPSSATLSGELSGVAAPPAPPPPPPLPSVHPKLLELSAMTAGGGSGAWRRLKAGPKRRGRGAAVGGGAAPPVPAVGESLFMGFGQRGSVPTGGPSESNAFGGAPLTAAARQPWAWGVGSRSAPALASPASAGGFAAPPAGSRRAPVLVKGGPGSTSSPEMRAVPREHHQQQRPLKLQQPSLLGRPQHQQHGNFHRQDVQGHVPPPVEASAAGDQAHSSGGHSEGGDEAAPVRAAVAAPLQAVDRGTRPGDLSLRLAAVIDRLSSEEAEGAVQQGEPLPERQEQQEPRQLLEVASRSGLLLLQSGQLRRARSGRLQDGDVAGPGHSHGALAAAAGEVVAPAPGANAAAAVAGASSQQRKRGRFTAGDADDGSVTADSDAPGTGAAAGSAPGALVPIRRGKLTAGPLSPPPSVHITMPSFSLQPSPGFLTPFPSLNSATSAVDLPGSFPHLPPLTLQFGSGVRTSSSPRLSALKNDDGAASPSAAGASSDAAVLRCSMGSCPSAQDESFWATVPPLPLGGAVEGMGSRGAGAMEDGGRMSAGMLRVRDQLVALAEGYATDDQVSVRALVGQLALVADKVGSPEQRLVFHFLSALTARADGSGTDKFLSPLPHSQEELSKGMQMLCRTVPFLQSCQVATHEALLAACEGHPRLHVLALGLWTGDNVAELFRRLSSQPSGPPQLVRITGVDAPVTPGKLAIKVSAASIAAQLQAVASSAGIRVEVEMLAVGMEALRADMVRVRADETLVAFCSMRMQFLPDATVVRANPRDNLIKAIHALRPSVFIMNECDANFNSPFYLARVREAVSFFAAAFDCVDAGSERTCPCRQIFEECYFGRDMVNVVACEGLQRMVRPERLEQWQARMARLGFAPQPLPRAVATRLRGMYEAKRREAIRLGLGAGSRNGPTAGFYVREEGAALRVGWGDTRMMFASAWVPIGAPAMETGVLDWGKPQFGLRQSSSGKGSGAW